MGWRIRNGDIDLARPRVMGIVNVTPDSFSDGGRSFQVDDAVATAARLAADGADILDVGGESTRPGAAPVSAQEEIRRVVPVIRQVASLGVPVSVDTRKAQVAKAAIDAGAAIINDVSALSDPQMAKVAADAGAGLVLMHMQGDPATMQNAPRYDDVVREVFAFLKARAEEAMERGVARECIVVDPGLGFGKRAPPGPDDNATLLHHLDRFLLLGLPLLVGASRKSFIGRWTGVTEPAARDLSSAAAAAIAVTKGARIIRAHDVRSTRQAVDVAHAVLHG